MTGAAAPPPDSWFERATVADVMRGGVLSCPGEAPLSQVADAMVAHRVHAVVVPSLRMNPVHGDLVAWGLITDLDVARAAAGDRQGVTASDIARTGAIGVDPATPLPQVATLMAERSISHLIVTRGSRPLGVISALDVAAALAADGEARPAQR